MKNNIPVGSYFGIKVYLHYTWFLVVALLSWALATGFFPETFPEYDSVMYWLLGLSSAIFLFISVLLHELSHSLVAKHFKMKVASITLFFFGGVASIHEGNMKAKEELAMAIAGPILSLALAGLFYAINISSAGFIHAMTAYLFRINLIIAVFNMVPGFPLDGGRVFRALAWIITKDYKKATRYATTGGKIVAYAMIFIGFVNVFAGTFAGLWFVFLGGFLLLMTTLSYEQAMMRESLGKMTVKDFAKKGPIISDHIKANTLAYKAIRIMLKKKIKTLSVFKGKTHIGNIAIKDLIGYVRKKNTEDFIKEHHLVEVEE